MIAAAVDDQGPHLRVARRHTHGESHRFPQFFLHVVLRGVLQRVAQWVQAERGAGRVGLDKPADPQPEQRLAGLASPRAGIEADRDQLEVDPGERPVEDIHIETPGVRQTEPD